MSRKIKKKMEVRKKLNKRKAILVRSKKGRQAKKRIIRKGAIKKKFVKTKKITKRKSEEAKNGEHKEPGFSPQSFFKAKIKVIGIGGGGGSIVSEIGRSLHKATFVVADTDSRAFKKKAGIKYFLFGQELTRGLGTGLNTDLARRAAEQERENIKKLFENQDIVIFVASLGGGLGSGATEVFVKAVSDFQGITFGIFTMPFKFEGKNKQIIASKALRNLRGILDVSITIPNERIFKVIGEDTAITEAFSTVNKSLIESLESLIDLIYNPGVINIDFADVRAILKGKGNLAYLNTAEAAGKDRADKIIESMLNNPLYQTGGFTPEKVLFNIASGGNLSMFEVDKISRKISEESPKAKIIFGISKNAKNKNKIKTTILMTGPSSTVKSSAKAEVKVKAVAKPKPVKKISPPSKKLSPSLTLRRTSRKARKKVKARVVPVPEFLRKSFNNEVLKAEEGSIREDLSVAGAEKTNKTIRRSALEIRKERELEEGRMSEQEKEWEVPAFMRLKNKN